MILLSRVAILTYFIYFINTLLYKITFIYLITSEFIIFYRYIQTYLLINLNYIN